MSELYDKNRRPIMVGDVLKVYHFCTGFKCRRVRYMYKWVLEKVFYPRNSYFRIGHLQNPNDIDKESYVEIADDSIKPNIEIIQGYGDNGLPFDERKKKCCT
jgi:hypothetical protein